MSNSSPGPIFTNQRFATINLRCHSSFIFDICGRLLWPLFALEKNLIVFPSFLFLSCNLLFSIQRVGRHTFCYNVPERLLGRQEKIRRTSRWEPLVYMIQCSTDRLAGVKTGVRPGVVMFPGWGLDNSLIHCQQISTQ